MGYFTPKLKVRTMSSLSVWWVSAHQKTKTNLQKIKHDGLEMPARPKACCFSWLVLVCPPYFSYYFKPLSSLTWLVYLLTLPPPRKQQLIYLCFSFLKRTMGPLFLFCWWYTDMLCHIRWSYFLFTFPKVSGLGFEFIRFSILRDYDAFWNIDNL